MSLDITSLAISVKSDGIQQATKDLEALSQVSSKVEAKAKTIKEATSGLSASQQAAAANIEKLIAGFQKQADLLGANTSQMNSYVTAMKGGTQLEQAMAAMLGAEVDAYKAKGIAQQQAIKDNQALDSSYKKLQADVDAYYAAQAKAQAAGNALNAAGQREQELRKIAEAQRELTKTTNELAAADARQKAIQQNRDIEMRAMSYTRLASAQTEALKINNELIASQARQKSIEQARDVELHAMSYQKLAAMQAEAIKMNIAYDASLRRLNQDEAARKQSLFNNTLQQGHDLARGLSGSLGALWLTYGNIGMMIAGVAIGASLKEAVTGFAKVEYQMTFVKALAEDTTHSVAELTARMHDVAGALGIAPEAAAKGLRALTQAGLNTSDALATLPVAFKLATVGELALEQAALAATGVMNAYDLKVSNLEHIGDVMAKAGAMSAASVDSISVSMKYSAGTAEQYGVSLEKLGTILTLLGKRGITGSSAGVAANNLIAELYSPSSEKAIKAAAALGVKAYVDGVRQPIEDVVKSFKDNLGKFDTESQGMLLEAMFGKKGGKAFYAVAQGTKEDFQAMETQLVNSTGFVADVYKANLKTVEGQLNLTKSAVTNMFAKVGEESAAPIKDLMVSIRNMANSQGAQDAFIGLTQSIKTFITTVVPAAATLGALFLSFKIGAAMTAAYTAAIGFAETAISIGLIPAVKALNIAMLSNPFGLVLGVITLLAAAYMLLKHNKESVHDLHKKDMDQAAETLKAGNDEIEMLKKQLALRGQNIRGDAEASAIKELQANEQVQTIQQRIIDNNTKIYSAAGKNRGPSQMGSAGNNALEKELESASAAARENKQLEKDLAVAQGTYKQLADQNKLILDLKTRLRAEDKRMDAEDLANATPKLVGTLKYGNDKGAKAAGADAYSAAITKEHDLIKASKTAMQTFEDTQNNLYKAGEIGKLKFIQEVGNKQVEELTKQHKAIEAQIGIAAGKKNGKADTQKFTDDLVANELAAKTAKIRTAEETNVQLAKYAEDNTKFQIQELEIQGKFGAAAALKFSSENKLAFKQAEQDIADFGDKFPIITERFKQLQAARDAAVSAGDNKEALTAFNIEADKVRNTLKGVQTASEGQGLAAMFVAAREASAKYAEELPILQARIAAMRAMPVVDEKGIEEAQGRLTNNAESYRKMWVGVGDSISKSLKDAFGKSGQAAGDLIRVAQNYNNLEKKSGEARVKSYGDAASAAKGFFKEGTNGYNILATAEKAFRALELVGMLQSLVMTGTTEAGKQALKVPTVLMEFMAQMGPWGMAAGAAAIAAIGVTAFGGGGGGVSAADRQKTQGTGSVLGMDDAKSASIVNSLAIMEKNSGLGLAQGNKMVGYLKSVSDNITSLASLIVRTTDLTGTAAGNAKGTATKVGEAVGTYGLGPVSMLLDKITGGWFSKISGSIFNSVFGGKVTTLDTGFTANKTSLGGVMSNGISTNQYTDTKKDGGWFSSDKYSTSLSSLGADANAQFTQVITGMGDALKEAGKTLGIGGDAFNRRLESFVVDIGKISLKDLSGDEIQKALEAVFSKLGDDMAKFAIVGLDKFTKVGEGYLETVMRVTNDLMQVRDVFAVLGKSFTLTGIAAVTVSENLIAAAGSLDALTSGTKYFVDNFLTEAERMAPITLSVQQQMQNLGYMSVNTVAEFSKLVRSLDLTDPASQKLYASLLSIAPAFYEAATYADKLADGTVTLTAAQQKALDAVTKAKTNLQDAYNAESSALQSTIDKTTAFIGTLKTYQDSLKLGADSPLTNMQKYAEARKQFDATAAAAQGGDQAAKDKFTSASSALLSASKLINASGDGYTSDFNMVQNMIDKLVGSSTTQVDTATASLNALNAQVAGLIDVNKSVMSVTQAITELQKAITLGGIAGLSNTQMQTTYTPTPAQVASATPNQVVMPAPVSGFVTVVQDLKTSVDALRTEQAAQTGALVQATYGAADSNAEDTVGGLAGAINGAIKNAKAQIALV